MLASGFFVFSYVDAAGADFAAYLFNRSGFWRLMAIFDTAPMLALIGLFTVLDRSGVNPPGLVPMTLAVTYVVGTLQWYFVGGAAGLLLERFWSGLKTGDEPDADWF